MARWQKKLAKNVARVNADENPWAERNFTVRVARPGSYEDCLRLTNRLNDRPLCGAREKQAIILGFTLCRSREWAEMRLAVRKEPWTVWPGRTGPLDVYDTADFGVFREPGEGTA